MDRGEELVVVTKGSIQCAVPRQHLGKGSQRLLCGLGEGGLLRPPIYTLRGPLCLKSRGSVSGLGVTMAAMEIGKWAPWG